MENYGMVQDEALERTMPSSKNTTIYRIGKVKTTTDRF